MSKLWIDGSFVPVTLFKFVNQTVARYTSVEKDGVQAAVVDVTNSREGRKPLVQKQFVVDDEFQSAVAVGGALESSLFDDCVSVSVTAISKGKGFQGNVKRNNFAGGPKTHGSKFHRGQGTTGRRKPRRTEKGFPMAGRMGGDTITLHKRKVIDVSIINDETIVAIK